MHRHAHKHSVRCITAALNHAAASMQRNEKAKNLVSRASPSDLIIYNSRVIQSGPKDRSISCSKNSDCSLFVLYYPVYQITEVL